MKITAGLGSIDDYISFVEAGVDEVFIGYVPCYLNNNYINHAPVNRREVLFYQVQIGSRSDLQILSKMVQKFQIPVAITLNALSYLPEEYPLLKRMVEECLEDGFDTFIVADLALLVYFRQTGILNRIKVQMSGEIGEINHYLNELCNDFGIQRMIFHRKMNIHDMHSIIVHDSNLEYEAFVLNEMCHFHGGYCNSLHCDELCHLCLVPYRMEKEIELKDHILSNAFGASGCGVCALWDLQEAGVTFLKIVGRGNLSEMMVRDIITMKKALNILENSGSKLEFIRNMKRAIFPEGCLENCYYPNESKD